MLFRPEEIHGRYRHRGYFRTIFEMGPHKGVLDSLFGATWKALKILGIMPMDDNLTCKKCITGISPEKAAVPMHFGTDREA